jgi:uncharacterized protein YjbI with pentapeptide repeats
LDLNSKKWDDCGDMLNADPVLLSFLENEMIDLLTRNRGNIRTILGVDGEELLDISHADWANRFEVIRGLELNRVRLADTKVAVNFVECSFDLCEFSHIETQSHFFGAGNIWRGCKFDNLDFVDIISPQSRFIDCEFRDSRIRGFRLCQTLFDSCQFFKCKIGGIASRSVGNPSMQLPEVSKLGANALFQSCGFSGIAFEGCRLDKVGFADCQIADNEFTNCDFSEAIGDDTWMKQLPKGDPFLAFLDALLEGIEKQLGSDSAAMRELSSYSDSYRSGKTTSKDYSACLYSGRVPDQELDDLQKTLDQTEAAFPF